MKSSYALLLGLAALLAAALPAAASGAASSSYTIAGYEYAFTSTVGSFAGTGAGTTGGKAYWNATVKHDPLGSHPTYVNGGSFAMTVRGPGASVDAIVGTFSHHGGMITTIDRGANCGNQKYLVVDTLRNVATPTRANGAGNFRATLTHYRHRVFGHCIAYKARVSGEVRVTF
jgi:hypothetical protein